ncbi:hypothetical protein J0H58_31965 [bacterium]|nr:hypothetical protein [bacterium]
MTTGERVAGQFPTLQKAERVFLAALIDEALVLVDARRRVAAGLLGRLADAVGTLALSAADAGAKRKTVALAPAALVTHGAPGRLRRPQR